MSYSKKLTKQQRNAIKAARRQKRQLVELGANAARESVRYERSVSRYGK